MILIENGYLQDGLKAVVYLIPLIYLIIKRRQLKLKYYWLFFIGLSLLFFGNLLDFFDEFKFLQEIFSSDNQRYMQDFFEDIVGLTLGFVVFIEALYLEFFAKKIAKS
ncbi:MAG: hypothetical protein JSV93_06175 [Candidatus Omnitrophota bacterium]|nr:MAG: hypothetical protein JSV93_06175 [Candidatus Omnitrophota bacterium]